MRILVLGDSFVEGVGSSSGGWAKMLADSRPADDVTVSGVGGDNTVKLLARTAPFDSQRFDCVLIEVGLNDSRYRPSKDGSEVPIAEYADNLSTLARYFQERGATVTFVGLTRVDEGVTRPYKEDKHYINTELARYDEVLRKTANACDANYIGVPALADESGMLFDGVHPSEHGHRILVDVIQPRV